MEMSGKFHTPGGKPSVATKWEARVHRAGLDATYVDGVQSDRDLQQSAELLISLTEMGVT
jgi:hypothetical protein